MKSHPFPIVAHFDRVVALSFAFPVCALKPMIPEGLEIDSYGDFGFVTVAMVWTCGMRPAGFPNWLGQDFFLAGYRIFTRLEDKNGRRLRGLKIIRSETDKRGMVRAGNIMTGYNYRLADIRIKENGGEVNVVTSLPDGGVSLDLTYDTGMDNVGLPRDSPFPDWRTARRFAGPMPFTFSSERDGRFVVIEGSRGSWNPRPVAINHWDVALFREVPLLDYTPVLANAFMVENVDYRWKRGRIISARCAQ